ncbi:MAG: DMT family transporter [Candidatus Omnitrophota bacterium]
MSTPQKHDHYGLILGFIAVSCFGFTLPMTRLAVTQLDPVFVSMGRAFFASLVAAGILLVQRAPRPSAKATFSLYMVGFCISFAFPLLVAYAMKPLPAAHGAIVIGLLPIATTYCIHRMDHEKPSASFWQASLLGGFTVVGYALLKAGGVFHPADILLLATVVVGAVGYAHGAVLAKTMGGMRVMCWALVYMMPVLAVGAIPQIIRVNASEISWTVWGAFVYLAMISQLFGMALWYKALSSGSVVKVSQVQLLQPFLTIIFAWLFFGEQVDLLTWAAASVVVFSIQLSRRARVRLNHSHGV